MRKKWEAKACVKRFSRISQKEFEERLDEVMDVLLNNNASSNETFSTRSIFPDHHGLFGDFLNINDVHQIERTGTDD